MQHRKLRVYARYLWFADRGERGEWVAVIYEKRGRNTVVVTAGCEMTEPEIKQWCAAQIELIETTGNRDADVPDMRDRAKGKQ
jgi:hypothetical protein